MIVEIFPVQQVVWHRLDVDRDIEPHQMENWVFGNDYVSKHHALLVKRADVTGSSSPPEMRVNVIDSLDSEFFLKVLLFVALDDKAPGGRLVRSRGVVCRLGVANRRQRTVYISEISEGSLSD